MRVLYIWLTGIVLSGVSVFLYQKCKKSHDTMTAEDVVQEYLETALNMENIEEKESLIQYATGNLKAALVNADEKTLMDAYINRKYDLKAFSIIKRRDRTPREIEITFQLSYIDYGAKKNESPTQGSKGVLVTTENTVAVIKEKNLWLIRDVLGSSTRLDFPLGEGTKIIINQQNID